MIERQPPNIGSIDETLYVVVDDDGEMVTGYSENLRDARGERDDLGEEAAMYRICAVYCYVDSDSMEVSIADDPWRER